MAAAAALARCLSVAATRAATANARTAATPGRFAKAFRAFSTDPEDMRKVGVIAEELAKSIKDSTPEASLEKAQEMVKALTKISGISPGQATTFQDQLALKCVDSKLQGFDRKLTEVLVGQNVLGKYNVLFVGIFFGGIITIPLYIFKVKANGVVADERSKKNKKGVKELRKEVRSLNEQVKGLKDLLASKFGNELETATEVTASPEEKTSEEEAEDAE